MQVIESHHLTTHKSNLLVVKLFLDNKTTIITLLIIIIMMGIKVKDLGALVTDRILDKVQIVINLYIEEDQGKCK